MTIQSLPYVSLLGFFFGSTLIASRFSVGQFHPTTYIGLRLLMASLAHTAVYVWGKHRAWPRDRQLYRHAIILGLFGTAIPMTAIVSSLQYLSSGLAAILITTNPALTVIMAHFFLLEEKLTIRKTIGVTLALSGALLLALSGENGLPNVSQTNPIGYGLMAIAMLSGSAMTVYARKYMQAMDSFDVSTIRMITAAIIVVPLSVLFFGFDLQFVTGSGYMALVYAALVGTFAGMLLSFYIVKQFGATPAAMTAYIIPIVTGIGGLLILGEQITPVMLGGMVLIFMGIGILNQKMTQTN